jgi:2-iminoacetate synthase
MSFLTTYNAIGFAELQRHTTGATASDVAHAFSANGASRLERFAVLISPVASSPDCLEQMAQRSRATTVRHFGQVIRLFAPLYLSNECINVCKYCGFSRDNPILRVTLTVEQVVAEARYLHDQGFRHILLVAGEHPHFVSGNYLRDCVARLRPEWPSISLEVGPMETAEYAPIVEAGAEGLVVYQETYDRAVYHAMHSSGPKKDFDWRLETPERAYAAGFKRIGVGALLGLSPWRQDAIAVATHVDYLLKKCWKAQITVSVPRLRPAAGEIEPLVHVSDRELVQLVCALRLTFPEVGIVLSTREPARLRDGMIQLGVTMMSAGSHTEPGGYTGQGRGDLHLTTRGRPVRPPLPLIESEGEHATVQFQIADDRSAAEVATELRTRGYEPVWKDWEGVLNVG